MKEVFYIDDTPANKISYYFMLAFLVTLPFDRLFSELALIGLLAHTAIHWRKNPGMSSAAGGKAGTLSGRPGRAEAAWFGWLTGALYGLTVVGTLWSARQAEAFKEWEKQLAFLLFPLLFYFTQLDWTKYQRPLLKAFAFSCLFTTIYLYGVAFSMLRQQGFPLSALFSPPFMNHAFSTPIDLHATYFSMYIAISLVTLVVLLFQARGISRWGYALASLILLAAILQLAARSVCISLLLILNGLLPFWLRKGRARWGFVLITLSFTMLAFAAIFRNENLHTRYLVQLRQDLKGNIGNKNGPEPRMVRWSCAWELIRASPWIGYGTGTEVDLLKEKYETHQLYDSYAHELNAHNQYLSIALKTGVLGELLFLGILVTGFRQAVRLKDPWLGSFLVIVVCVSFSENILDVNKGIFFFSFFFSFLLAKSAGPIFVRQYGNKNTLPPGNMNPSI